VPIDWHYRSVPIELANGELQGKCNFLNVWIVFTNTYILVQPKPPCSHALQVGVNASFDLICWFWLVVFLTVCSLSHGELAFEVDLSILSAFLSAIAKFFRAVLSPPFLDYGFWLARFIYVGIQISATWLLER